MSYHGCSSQKPIQPLVVPPTLCQFAPQRPDLLIQYEVAIDIGEDQRWTDLNGNSFFRQIALAPFDWTEFRVG